MLKIMSVCRTLPTPDDPVAGTFVFDRLAAMAQQADLRVVQPLPYFPGLRPLPAWGRADHHVHRDITIEHAPMLYVPGVLKSLDGSWLARSIWHQARSARRAGALHLIDAHFGYPDGAGCAAVGQRLGVPVFVTLRGLEVDILRHPALRPRLLQALHAAAGCISVSHTLKDLVVAQGVAADKIAVIPNAVDTELFRPGDRAAARAALGIGMDEPLCVSVGNLLHVKRHDLLLRALHTLRRKHPTASLVIIGGAAHEPATPAALRELSAELGLQRAVRFLGKVPAHVVVQWLHAADVFTLASDREGCCNAVLEALAVGLPVVATAAGDNAQYVKPGQNGLLTAPGDWQGLATALDHALSSRTWQPRAISRALHDAVGNWTDVATRVLQFFQERLTFTADRSHAFVSA